MGWVGAGLRGEAGGLGFSFVARLWHLRGPFRGTFRGPYRGYLRRSSFCGRTPTPPTPPPPPSPHNDAPINPVWFQELSDGGLGPPKDMFPPGQGSRVVGDDGSSKALILRRFRILYGGATFWQTLNTQFVGNHMGHFVAYSVLYLTRQPSSRMRALRSQRSQQIITVVSLLSILLLNKMAWRMIDTRCRWETWCLCCIWA